MGQIVGRGFPCVLLGLRGDACTLLVLLCGLVLLAVEGPESHVVRRAVQEYFTSAGTSPATTPA